MITCLLPVSPNILYLQAVEYNCYFLTTMQTVLATVLGSKSAKMFFSYYSEADREVPRVQGILRRLAWLEIVSVEDHV